MISLKYLILKAFMVHVKQVLMGLKDDLLHFQLSFIKFNLILDLKHLINASDYLFNQLIKLIH